MPLERLFTMTTTQTLSTAQEAAMNLLRESGTIKHGKLVYHLRRTFKSLEDRGLVGWRAAEDDFEWFIPTEATASSENTVDLAASEIAEQRGQPVVYEFKRWDTVNTPKGQGRYMGVCPGDPRFASIRIDGNVEAVKVGDVRLVAEAQHAMPLLYNKPALPTDADVLEVMSREYPTVVTADGLGQHRNKGMLEATFATLNLVELGNEAKPAAAEGQIVNEKPESWIDQLVDLGLRKVASGMLGYDISTPKPIVIPTNGAIEDVPFTPVTTAETPAVTAEPDIFKGMAEMVIVSPMPQPKPVQKPRKAPSLATLNVTPSMFKQVHRGIVMSSDKVFSRHNVWRGEAWLIGTWSELSLALTKNGDLLMLDGAIAYQVRTSEAAWEAIATAWFGLGWRRGERVSAGGVK